MLESVRRDGLKAVKRHVQASAPMVGYRDGQALHVPPEELVETPATAAKESPSPVAWTNTLGQLQ